MGRAGCHCPRRSRLTARQGRPTRRELLRRQPYDPHQPFAKRVGGRLGLRVNLGLRPRLVFVCRRLLVEAEHAERLVVSSDSSRARGVDRRVERRRAERRRAERRSLLNARQRAVVCAVRRRREQGAAHLLSVVVLEGVLEGVHSNRRADHLVAHIGF